VVSPEVTPVNTSSSLPAPRSPLFRVVSVVFGVALLAAAVLKFFYPGGLVASPVTDALPTWAQGLVPVFEVALGGWLVSGFARFGA